MTLASLDIFSIIDLFQDLRMLWWGISAIIIIYLIVQRIRNRKHDDFERRDN